MRRATRPRTSGHEPAVPADSGADALKSGPAAGCTPTPVGPRGPPISAAPITLDVHPMEFSEWARGAAVLAIQAFVLGPD